MSWHYVENGQQAGPVTEEQLQQLFQSGRINADTLVWREGMPDWTTYHQAVPQPSPPPTIQPPAADTEATQGESEVVCAECGKMFPMSETVKFGKASVCAACKPVFLQKLSEGAKINTGELAYARIFTRFAAVLLDGLILMVFNFGTNFLAGFLFALNAKSAANGHPAGFLGLQFGLMAFNLAIGLTYESVLIGKYGATLGKMACKIKVVTADGGKVSYGRAFGRYFAKMLSGFTCLIGYIIACFDDQKRALHDRLCNTRVVER